MNFLDLFSGIGGFRLGLERNGHTPVGYVEIDKFARQSYNAMYDTTGEWTATDITKVTDEEWSKFNGKVDIIAGGFPCQAFSIAGKRLGFLDSTKGTLFFEIARATKQIKPRYLFLENVKGLLNHEGGDTFRTILNTLDELGYDVEWRLLNSKDFGVPQNRERVYIIGHLRGDSGREVFPFFGENGEVNPTNVKRHVELSESVHTPKVMVKEATKKGYDIATIGDSINIAQPNSKTRRGRVGHGVANTLVTGSEQATLVVNHDVIKNNIEEYAHKVTKKDFGISETKDGSYRVHKKDVRKSGIQGLDFTNPNGISGTLTTNHPQNTWSEDYRIRKLTPRECWRLQAFPDELFDKAKATGMSDSQLYKQAGNSVTVNVIEAIAKGFK